MTKKDDTLTVFPFGTEVIVGDKIEGKIRAVTIGPNNTVYYQVAYWSGNSLTTEDFHESEVFSSVSNKQKIGFS